MSCWYKLKSSVWAHATTILCLYGFFAHFKVGDPFITPYLTGPYKNISEEVVTNYLYPIWTYSNLASLFFVLLLTDFLRYKPLIIVQVLCQILNAILLCFIPGLAAMVVLQVNLGVAIAADVVYVSYIYSIIPIENYQRATGYTRSAILLGFGFGGALGQVLVSLAGLDYFYLYIIYLGVQILAFFISVWLPMPETSMFFKRQKMDSSSSEKDSLVVDGAKINYSWKNVTRTGQFIWQSIRETYTSRKVIWWSMATTLSLCGFIQVAHYIQLLWQHIESSATSSIYNGAVEAVCNLVGAAAAFCVGHVKVSWSVWGELCLGLFLAVEAGAVFLMVLTSNIWACYAGYVIFSSCFNILTTITTFLIASKLSMECYALTFGINTLIALLLQTILTLVVVDKAVLGLDIFTQFIIYGCYHALISVMFLIQGMYTAWTHQNESDEKDCGVEVTK